MAEENKGTGSQASAVPEAESRPYELKQVQVRLRLSEAGSIYSSKEITNDVRAAEVMSDVLETGRLISTLSVSEISIQRLCPSRTFLRARFCPTQPVLC